MVNELLWPTDNLSLTLGKGIRMTRIILRIVRRIILFGPSSEYYYADEKTADYFEE